MQWISANQFPRSNIRKFNNRNMIWLMSFLVAATWTNGAAAAAVGWDGGLARYYVPPEVLAGAVPLPEPDPSELGAAGDDEQAHELLVNDLELDLELWLSAAGVDDADWTEAAAAWSSRSWGQISETTAYPYCTIGKLYMRWDSSWYVASAVFMLSEKMILTAGHCLYFNPTGVWAYANQVIFVPGKSGAAEPFGQIACTRSAVPSGWGVSHDLNYDWGVAELTTAGGLGFMGWRYNDSSSWYVGRTVNVTGYPEGYAGHGEEMWQNQNTIANASGNRFTCYGTAYGGMDGGPAWETDNFIVGNLSTYNDLGCTRLTRTSVNAMLEFLGTATWTPAGTATATPTPPPPTATPTSVPTNTPTPRPTSTPPGPTATPTATSVPFEGVRLAISSQHFIGGMNFLLTATVYSSIERQVDLYCALDVYGAYYFYPGWNMTVNYLTIPIPSVDISLLGPFTWPQVEGQVTGLFFWGLACRVGTYDLAGGIDKVEFGYGS